MPHDRAAALRSGAATVLLFIVLSLRPQVLSIAPAPERPVFALALTLLAAALGFTATRDGVAAIFARVQGQPAVVWRNLLTWTLLALVLVIVAASSGVNLSGLLVGGAILGVVVASASQVALGNFFAGLVLMFTAPFRIGDSIRLRTALASSEQYEGRVIDARAQHTTLLTRAGDLIRVPNSAVLNSVIVVGAQAETEVEVELTDPAAVDTVRDHLRHELAGKFQRLELDPVSATLDGGAGPNRLVCRLRLRAAEPVDPADVARALARSRAA